MEGEVEVEVEVHCVILTRAVLHSRWEVEVEVEVLPEHIDSGALEGLAAT